jgi:four helix bundle protein
MTMNEKPVEIRERTFQFSIGLISLLKSLDKNYIGSVLGKQILRSGTSIGANVAEAYGSGSRRDFSQFFTIAYKSARETKYWLELFQETKSGDKEQVQLLLKDLDHILKILAASLRTLRGK